MAAGALSLCAYEIIKRPEVHTKSTSGRIVESSRITPPRGILNKIRFDFNGELYVHC